MYCSIWLKKKKKKVIGGKLCALCFALRQSRWPQPICRVPKGARYIHSCAFSCQFIRCDYLTESNNLTQQSCNKSFLHYDYCCSVLIQLYDDVGDCSLWCCLIDCIVERGFYYQYYQYSFYCHWYQTLLERAPSMMQHNLTAPQTPSYKIRYDL